MKESKNGWFKTLGAVVAVIVFLSGGLAAFGAIPWATREEIKDLKKLPVMVGKIETNIQNIQEDIKELLRR